jgi:hypothetical protein
MERTYHREGNPLPLIAVMTNGLEAICPIIRSSASMSDSPNGDCRFSFRIDDHERKPPKQESSCVAFSSWPALRSFTDCRRCPIQFFDEIQSCFGAALPIPGDCVLNIRDCVLVIFDAPSAHSQWPGVRDAVVPRERLPLFPLSSLPSDALLLRPKPVEQIHSPSQGCRATC